MDHLIQQVADSPAALAAIAVSALSLGYVLYPGRSSTNLSAPPGPKPDFLIGNLRQFPRDRFYEKFCEWQKLYGDIVCVGIPGISVVVLNSYEAALDLLSKRPNTTGGRKIGFMLREIMGWRWSLAFLQPGIQHSAQRKMLRRGIGPQKVGSHSERMEKQAGKLALELHNLEGNPRHTILRGIGMFIIQVAYGENISNSMGKELSSWNIEAMDMVNKALFTFWFVDIFRWLQFVPAWFPGANFKRIGARSTRLADAIRYQIFDKVTELYNTGTLGNCLAAELIEEFGANDDTRDALAILYTAGADTTSSAVTAFLHNLLIFPEVSKKVYEEIIAVTGGDRMLREGDRANLPYTEAMWKESFRWSPWVPVGPPHVNSNDEVFNGYFIKKGTLIMVNSGFMMNDPKVWGDPESFRPERFLEPGGESLPNPITIVFGYGMRICPGMYLADRGGFCIASTIALLYEIMPLDGQQRPDPNNLQFEDGALRLPVNFQCRFVPRNQKSKDLISSIALHARA